MVISGLKYVLSIVVAIATILCLSLQGCLNETVDFAADVFIIGAGVGLAFGLFEVSSTLSFILVIIYNFY